MELADLKNDSLLKGKYREVGILNIYSYLGQKYPEVKKFAAEIMCYFGSTYLFEQFFSFMKINKTIHRSRLTDENMTAIMKVKYAQSLSSNLEKLSAGNQCFFLIS